MERNFFFFFFKSRLSSKAHELPEMFIFALNPAVVNRLLSEGMDC